MFIGHFAVALAAKRASPRLSLGVLFLAGEFLDLLWPVFLALDLEHVKIAPGITAVTPLDFVSYPYSHSLVAAAGWSVLLGGAYWAWRRRMWDGTILGLVVLSHWVLDYITHRPDMPLTPWGTTRVGLGLWFSWPGTLAVELSMFAAGVAIYLRTTKGVDGIGRYGFWALVISLLGFYAAALLGPPPPSEAALAWGGQAIWLLVAWGWWVDRHRIVRPSQSPELPR